MAYTFTRTGAQIEEIHNTVEDPKSNTQFSDDIRTIAGEYRGLWPDTGGSANKGDTYQTQVSGTPTGQYFTALQNTTVDPVGDDVNWRVVVSVDSFSKYTDIVYKASGGNSAVENMILGDPIAAEVGGFYSTGGTTWERTSQSQGDISDFSAIGIIHVLDFKGSTISEKTQLAIDSASNFQTLVIGYSFGGFEVSHQSTQDAIQVNKPVNIRVDASIKNTYQTENQPNPPTIFNITSDNVNIYGLGSLEGSGYYTAAGIQASVNNEWSSLIYLNDVNDVSITGITLINPPKAGVYIKSSSNLDISCKFIGGPTFAEVSGHHSQANIYSYLGGGNNTISGCSFLKDELTGRVAVQHILNSTDAVPFKWNVSYNSFQSPHEHDTYLYLNGSIVNGNTMIHNSPSSEQQGSALKMGGDRNVIMSNNITGATSGGMDVISPSNTIISYNILKDVGTVGINVDNNTAIAHRMDNNEISHNRLTGINNNFEGIRYIFDTTYGSDLGCSGGKICYNTIDSFGSPSAIRASISVRRNGATSEVMDNFEICGNIVTGSNGNGIYLSSVKNPKVRHNNIYDNPALTFRAIYLDDVNGGDVEFNDVADHQAVTTLNAAIYMRNNAKNLSINYNNVYGAYTGAVPILLNQANNNTGIGNRISEVDNLNGVFTMNGVRSIEVFNANILDSGLLSQNTVIDIRPLNQEAAAAMGSSKMLFVYDKDAGLSFKVRTSDNTALPATDHVFSYQIN